MRSGSGTLNNFPKPRIRSSTRPEPAIIHLMCRNGPHTYERERPFSITWQSASALQTGTLHKRNTSRRHTQHIPSPAVASTSANRLTANVRRPACTYSLSVSAEASSAVVVGSSTNSAPPPPQHIYSVHIILTYHTVCITVRVGRTFAHLHLESTLVVGQQLLGSMVPDDVRRWFECPSHDAPQNDRAAGLHVTIRIADQLRAGH